MKVSRTLLIAAALLALLAALMPAASVAAGGSSDIEQHDAFVAVESFADALNELHTEMQADAEAEAEVDTEVDAEAEAEVEADAEAEAEAEAETEVDAQAEAEAETETEADADAEAETEVDAEADADAETEVEGESADSVLALVELGSTGAPKAEVKKHASPFKVAGPKKGDKQVHVHLRVAAPKLKRSNAGLRAMVDRIARKNQAAAEKMEQILDKLKTQDCRGGNCLPHPGRAMEQWKADWILETEETGKTVP